MTKFEKYGLFAFGGAFLMSLPFTLSEARREQAGRQAKEPVLAPSDATDAISKPAQEAPVSGKPASPMTEAQRLALVEADPDLKKASDFLGFLINSNGHLCARVSNVELVSGTQYEVTCVEYRNGSGRVRYLVDGATNEATPL